MRMQKPADMLGRDYYRLLYQDGLKSEAEWFRRVAVDKVDSIEQLLKRNGVIPKNILELGSGTGAVIQQCQRRNLGTKYLAVDYAPEAIEYLRDHSEGIEAIQADITAPDFYIHDPIDLLILSHVLEHLENPPEFLSAVKRSLRFKYAVIEVPLEDLFVPKMKSLLKDRTVNRSGHIQFFTMRTFERLISSSGFKIIDRRIYIPVLDMATIRFVSEKEGLSKSHYLYKLFTNHYLPILLKPLWKKWNYAHHAVLCTVDR
jgi:SAM-dependent methyltransferase